MALLVYGPITVPVALDSGADESEIEFGDRGEAIDGSPLIDIIARKSSWPVRTTPISTAAADALRTQVRTVPNTASGDLVGGGPVSVYGRWIRRTPVSLPDGSRLWICEFEFRGA